MEMQIKSVESKEIENSIFKIQKHFKLLLILKILVYICITEYNHSDLVHLPTTEDFTDLPILLTYLLYCPDQSYNQL